MKNLFYKDSNIPYIEVRHTTHSNKEYKEHFHTTLSIGAIIDGTANFTSNKKRIILNQETLVVLNPLTLHSCNPIKSNFRSYYMLYLDTNWAYNLQKTIFTNINAFAPVSKNLIIDKNDYIKFIKLNNSLLNKDILYLQKQEAIEEFFRDFFKKHCNKKLIHTIETNKNSRKIEMAKEYIEHNYNKNLTIEEIAQKINLSPFHFSRIFKNSMNISPYQYLLNIRVEKAKDFLKNSSVKIADIAQELGFNDQSHFNRVFKSLTTITPYEYKIS